METVNTKTQIEKPTTTNFHPLSTAQELFTTQDICEIFHITKPTVEQWRLRGVGPRFVRLSGSRLIRYRRNDVMDYIEALVAVRSTTEADAVA